MIVLDDADVQQRHRHARCYRGSPAGFETETGDVQKFEPAERDTQQQSQPANEDRGEIYRVGTRQRLGYASEGEGVDEKDNHPEGAPAMDFHQVAKPV